MTEIETLLDVYNVGAACQALRDHLEVLTNWYIRRSRTRFWAGEPAALDTLWTVLETVTRAAAPLLPLTTEAIWRGLTGGASVHLEDWPDVSDWNLDPDEQDWPGRWTWSVPSAARRSACARRTSCGSGCRWRR